MLKRSILALLVVLLCLSPLACAEKNGRDDNESVKYTLYIGLNDKDTHAQIIPTGEAEQKLGDIAVKYVDGFTLYIGAGAFRDDQGMLKRETSLIAEFYFAEEEQIKKIMDEALIAFNQSAILLSKDQVIASLYPE